jgi:nucleoside diphosphate kinase
MLKLNEEYISYLYPDLNKKPYFREMIRFLISDVVTGMEIIGENSIENMKHLIGNANPLAAKE